MPRVLLVLAPLALGGCAAARNWLASFEGLLKLPDGAEMDFEARDKAEWVGPSGRFEVGLVDRQPGEDQWWSIDLWSTDPNSMKTWSVGDGGTVEGSDGPFGLKWITDCSEANLCLGNFLWPVVYDWDVVANDGDRVSIAVEGTFHSDYIHPEGVATLDGTFDFWGEAQAESSSYPGCYDPGLGICTELRDSSFAESFESSCDAEPDTDFLAGGCTSTGLSCGGKGTDNNTGQKYNVTIHFSEDACETNPGGYTPKQWCALVGSSSDPC